MDLPVGGPVPAGALLRAARAVAGLSQRSLAENAGIPKSVVSRLELDDTGQRVSVAAFVRLLDACGITVTVHSGGRQLLPDDDPERDRGRRRYPAHLEPHPPEGMRDWWGWSRPSWAPERTIPPPRVFHLSPMRRSFWLEQREYPPNARLWADTVHLAPPYRVHPLLERQREHRRRMDEQALKWRIIEEQVHRDIAAQRARQEAESEWDALADLPADDGLADEFGGEVAE